MGQGPRNQRIPPVDLTFGLQVGHRICTPSAVKNATSSRIRATQRTALNEFILGSDVSQLSR